VKEVNTHTWWYGYGNDSGADAVDAAEEDWMGGEGGSMRAGYRDYSFQSAISVFEQVLLS
jgi:hypothetical protein